MCRAKAPLLLASWKLGCRLGGPGSRADPPFSRCLYGLGLVSGVKLLPKSESTVLGPQHAPAPVCGHLPQARRGAGARQGEGATPGVPAHSALPTAVGPTAAGAVLPCGRGAEPGGRRAGQPGWAEGPPALHAAGQPVPLLPGEGRGGRRGCGEPSWGRGGRGRAGEKGRVHGPPPGVWRDGGPAEKGVGLRGAAPELAGGDLPAAQSRPPCWEFLRPSNHGFTSWTNSVERQRGGSFAESQSLLSPPACASPLGEVGAWVCV